MQRLFLKVDVQVKTEDEYNMGAAQMIDLLSAPEHLLTGVQKEYIASCTSALLSFEERKYPQWQLTGVWPRFPRRADFDRP